MKPIPTKKRGLLSEATAEEMGAAGRRGDTEVGHLTKGEMVIPHGLMREHPDLVLPIVKAMAEKGIDPRRYVVGTPQGPRNPQTGAEEFWGDGTGSGGGEGDHGGDQSSSGSTSNDMGASSSGGQADGTGSGGASTGGEGTGGSETTGPTGIAVIDQQIEKAVNNPVATGINAIAGFALGPVVGGLNTLSGLLGGPTIGGAVTGAVSAATSGTTSTGPGSPGIDGPSDGSGGDASQIPVRAGTPIPSEATRPVHAAPNGLLTQATRRDAPRPKPVERFSSDAYRELYVYDPLVGRMVPRPT